MNNLKTAASKSAKRERTATLIQRAGGKAPAGVALVDFREPTESERKTGKKLESLARQRLSRNGRAAA